LDYSIAKQKREDGFKEIQLAFLTLLVVAIIV